jgi:tetratricopeptide (TPR) repeat protein
VVRSAAHPFIEQARHRYRAGDHLGAVSLARQTLARYPEDPRALEFSAQLIRDSRGPVAALPLFERALKRSPQDLDLLGEYAATLGEAARNRAMLRVARRMVELDASHPRAYLLQAVLAARAGRDELARRLLWRAGASAQRSPAGMLLVGAIELRSGSPVQAVEQFDALVRSQPDNLSAQLLLGRALLATGEANEVVARLRTWATRADASPYLLTLIGRAYEQLGQRAAAAPYLDRAAQPLPSGTWVLPVDARGELALWRSRDELLEPGAAVPRLRSLLASGRSTEAVMLAVGLVQRYPGSADVARLAGDVHWLAGDPLRALASYQRAAQVRSDDALVLRMVLAHDAVGRRDDARALLLRRLALNPRDRLSAVMLAELASERGDWNQAAVLFDHAGALSGRADPRLLTDLAVARLQQGGRAEATAAATQAHALQRGNGRVAAVLAQVLRAGGERPREAAVLFAKAQRLGAGVQLAHR